MARRFWFAVTVLVTSLCLGLSAWQWSRLEQRRAANLVAIEGRALPVLELPSQGDGPPRAQRRVRARGVFDHGNEVILRGHLLTGAPGVHVVTPLRLAGGDSAILVHRGFVLAADGASPDSPIPQEPGEVVIEGIALPVPIDAAGGEPVGGAGRESWRRLDLIALRARLPYPVLEVYLLALPDSAHQGWPRRVLPPALDEGPHLSYALQWFGIGVAVLSFGLFFILGIGRRESHDLMPPPPPAPPASGAA